MLSLHLDIVGLLSNLHTNCMWILTKILLEINWKITISDWKSVFKLHWKTTVKVTEECDYIYNTTQPNKINEATKITTKYTLSWQSSPRVRFT